MELKKSTAFRVPVLMLNATDGRPYPTLIYSQMTVYIQKQGGSVVSFTPTNTDWFELDATNAPGAYDLLLSTSHTDTEGFLKCFVTNTYCNTYRGLYEVVAYTQSEVYAKVIEMYRLMGLESGTDLVVTPTTRVAGAISQTIGVVGSTVTVSR